MERTVTLAPLDRPHNAAISHVTQRNSPIKPCVERGTMAFIKTKKDPQNRTEASAKKNIWLLPPTGPYLFDAQSDDGPHDLSSFYRKLTYLVKVSVCISSNALLTVANLSDMGGSPNSINKDFLLSAWEKSVKMIKLQQLQKLNSRNAT